MVVTGYEIRDEVRAAQDAAVLRGTVAVPEIGAFLGRAFDVIAAALARQGLGPAGPPFARWFPTEDGRFDVEAGFPATARPAPDGWVAPLLLPGGPAAVTTHVGAYEDIGAAHEALAAWLVERSLEPAGAAWEVYLSEPDARPTVTEVVQPHR